MVWPTYTKTLCVKSYLLSCNTDIKDSSYRACNTVKQSRPKYTTAPFPMELAPGRRLLFLVFLDGEDVLLNVVRGDN